MPLSHVMVYAPRDEGELKVVTSTSLVEASYRCAIGKQIEPLKATGDDSDKKEVDQVNPQGFATSA